MNSVDCIAANGGETTGILVDEFLSYDRFVVRSWCVDNNVCFRGDGYIT